MASNLRLTSLNVKHLNVTDNIRINGQFFAGAGTAIGVSALVVNRFEDDAARQLANGIVFFNDETYQGGNKTLLSIKRYPGDFECKSNSVLGSPTLCV